MTRLQPSLPFVKMHGLGNDFVVVDARRGGAIVIPPALACRLADRNTGIGFDQLILLEPPRAAEADVFLRFLNADGSEAGACGNGSRCAAALVMNEDATRQVMLETISGLLPAHRSADGHITVDMGLARLRWDEVPLAYALETLHVPINIGVLDSAACTSMGNPHATFFVPDADAVDLRMLGPLVEHHALFPERVNVGVTSLIAPDQLRLRVWERGSGLTLACGSGACAALVAAVRREVTGRRAEIVMERGSLFVEWREDGHVIMTGPAAISFTGAFDTGL